MMEVLMVVAFFATIATGPDGRDWWMRRRAARERARDWAVARVHRLPDGAYREHTCAEHRGQYPCIRG